MPVVAGLGKAAVAGVLSESRPARGRAFPKTKKASVVVAVALLAFAALIPASQAPNAGHSYYSAASSTPDRSGTAAPVSSEPQAVAPRMSEEEALDAYQKLPLAFVANEGQITDEAVQYYAQGAGYGFFFSKERATLSFAEGKGRGGQALALGFLGADPNATLTAKKRLAGEVNYLVGAEPTEWRRGLATHAELLYGGCGPG